MPQILSAVRVPVPGGKLIEEYAGLVSTDTKGVSIARMVAPPGWSEPFQQPEFDEVTIVVEGTIRVDHEAGVTYVPAGELVLCRAGERIRYSNPFTHEAVYWAICAPAFSPNTVHRESD